MEINDLRSPGWPTGPFFVPVAVFFLCARGAPCPPESYEKLSVFNVFAVLGLQSFVIQRTLLSHCLSLPITLKTMKNTMKINDVKGPGWPTGPVFFCSGDYFCVRLGCTGPSQTLWKTNVFQRFLSSGVWELVMQRYSGTHCLSLLYHTKTLKNTKIINDLRRPAWPT